MKVGTNVILILLLSIALVVLALAFVGFKKYGDLNKKVDTYTQMLADRFMETERIAHNHYIPQNQTDDTEVNMQNDTDVVALEEVVEDVVEDIVEGEEDEEIAMKQFLNNLKESVETETIAEDVFLKRDLESISEVEEEEDSEVDEAEEESEDVEDVEELEDSDEEEVQKKVLVFDDEDEDAGLDLELEDNVSDFEERDDDDESDLSIEFS